MNKREAEKELDRLLDAQKYDVFCPLVRGLCRRDCICLTNKIERYNHSETYTAIVRCDNKMFTGTGN